jgi:ribosome-associated heat shock protein Hsp15
MPRPARAALPGAPAGRVRGRHGDPAAPAYNPPVIQRSDSSPPPAAATLRIDKWLWCARFFKSRGLAQAAVEGGHVQVNGERVKASRQVRVGDMVRITRDRERFEVEVAGIPVRRGPAPEARQHYRETPESEAARARVREFDRLSAPVSNGRPDKRERRDLIRVLKRPDRPQS